MRTGTCPKCNSKEVYKAYAQGSLDAGMRTGDGQPLLNIHIDKGGLFGDKFTLLTLEHYLCRSCGYLEHYVIDLAELDKLNEAKNWEKMG
jgi:predicted nucleic-acid-binding Zn-ribbon protein